MVSYTEIFNAYRYDFDPLFAEQRYRNSRLDLVPNDRREAMHNIRAMDINDILDDMDEYFRGAGPYESENPASGAPIIIKDLLLGTYELLPGYSNEFSRYIEDSGLAPMEIELRNSSEGDDLTLYGRNRENRAQTISIRQLTSEGYQQYMEHELYLVGPDRQSEIKELWRSDRYSLCPPYAGSPEISMERDENGQETETIFDSSIVLDPSFAADELDEMQLPDDKRAGIDLNEMAEGLYEDYEGLATSNLMNYLESGPLSAKGVNPYQDNPCIVMGQFRSPDGPPKYQPRHLMHIDELWRYEDDPLYGMDIDKIERIDGDIYVSAVSCILDKENADSSDGYRLNTHIVIRQLTDEGKQALMDYLEPVSQGIRTPHDWLHYKAALLKIWDDPKLCPKLAYEASGRELKHEERQQEDNLEER